MWTEEESTPTPDNGEKCTSHQKAKEIHFPDKTFAFHVPGKSKLEDKYLCKTKLKENTA